MDFNFNKKGNVHFFTLFLINTNFNRISRISAGFPCRKIEKFIENAVRCGEIRTTFLAMYGLNKTTISEYTKLLFINVSVIVIDF